MKVSMKLTRYVFTYMVAITTIITLLQVLLLYKNQGYVTDLRTGTGQAWRRELQQTTFTYNSNKKIHQHITQTSHLKMAAPKPVHKRRLTISIPTIRRPNKNYFPAMLRSMLRKTSVDDMKRVVFVIFLADLENTEWKNNTELSIKANYSEYIASGSLQVIQAPAEYYTDMATYKNNSYMNWRTKQNYDYAYIMKYCEHLSEFYMQMEDDVIASDGYFDAIMDFVKLQPDDNWVCLEFSMLGFIGKLYHTSDVKQLADIILMFNYSQPVDYLFVYFNMVTGKRTAIHKPTLFQHLGFHSSLEKKIQPLQDIFFDFPEKEIHGDNPPATVQTTLKTTDNFPPKLAYSDSAGFFWSCDGAKTGDTFLLIFNVPQNIRHIQIETALPAHPADKVQNAILEASPTFTQVDDTTECLYFVPLDTFTDGKINVNRTKVLSKLGLVKMKCLQIRFTEEQNEWVLIKEIAVFVADGESIKTL